jgi:Transposase domain (DUF772)
MGRPSIDPVLMIRMLIVGYVFAIRSERALCREVQVNLAYRWFCGLSIEDKLPEGGVLLDEGTSVGIKPTDQLAVHKLDGVEPKNTVATALSSSLNCSSVIWV